MGTQPTPQATALAPQRNGASSDVQHSPGLGTVGTSPAHTTVGGSRTSNGLPAVGLPSGGGAIRGIGEKFQVSGPTGTAGMSVPILSSAGRSSFGPKLDLSYDSGEGNGPFGLGWHLSIPSITRKTDKGLPRYDDETDSDIYVLSGIEDLVPVLTHCDGQWETERVADRLEIGSQFQVKRYRPRVESTFSRIERWSNTTTGEIHWRSITKDNITSLYGDCTNSRVFDPSDDRRIFSWLLSQVFDDNGNIIKYEYKAENAQGIDLSEPCEQNRTKVSRSVMRYPKRVKYGNRTPWYRQRNTDDMQWHFEIVFDYGEHDLRSPSPAETSAWSVRRDPFSTYRSTFEIRTYRLCRRVLMFHHFPGEENVGDNCLVASTDIVYDADEDSEFGRWSTISLLSSVQHRGYVRIENGYFCEALPPLEFEYTQAKVSGQVQDMEFESLQNVPVGADTQWYRFLDLDGEGLPGLLTHHNDSMFYKPNLGEGRFGPTELIPNLPSQAGSEAKNHQWLDIAADGHYSFVQFGDLIPGFSMRAKLQNGDWRPFKPFRSLPNIPWEDQNLSFVDLTGDGIADVLQTDPGLFTYYQGAGEDGFNAAKFWRPPVDEAFGPQLLYSGLTEFIFLADMSGDGLSDFVQIRNGEICYWPNLGYGRFGSKIKMGNSPVFDYEDIFHPNRIHLVDIKGAGVADIVYLHADHPVIYINNSGNSWSSGIPVKSFPPIHSPSQVQVADLLGHGTACLVWSSDLPRDQERTMRYLDLMSDGKPYLLRTIKNNLGLETHIEYESSTQFYLQDKLANNPWKTRLPFPVQVVTKATQLDRITGNKLVTRYAYHQGHFDPFEREYRGFGMVEKWDCEQFSSLETTADSDLNGTNDPMFSSPPVHVKLWYDTGAYVQGVHIAQLYNDEFYQGDPHVTGSFLESTVAPTSVRMEEDNQYYPFSIDEIREAYRALKGSLIREEIYGRDESKWESHPYRVSEANYVIECYQPSGPNLHAGFFVHPKERLECTYERNRCLSGTALFVDPQLSHNLILKTDQFGNVLRSVGIHYGRRNREQSSLFTDRDRAKQQAMKVTLQRQEYTNPVILDDSYRIPMLWKSESFEVLNMDLCGTALLGFNEVDHTIQELESGRWDLPFESCELTKTTGHILRRILSRSITLFRSNDFEFSLPYGTLESLALSFESYEQVFTDGLLEDIFTRDGKLPPGEQLARILKEKGGFVQLKDYPGFWSPSGRVYLSPGKHDTAHQEAEYASEHFYLPHRYRDAFYSETFNSETQVSYDQYNLLPLEIVDAVQNHTTCGIRLPNSPSGSIQSALDYRTLQPLLVMDPNRNCSAVLFDALGRVTATAVMGKPENAEGDSLAGVDVNLSEAEKQSYFNDPLGTCAVILGLASSRAVYDYFAYFRTRSEPHPQPPATATINRETHVSALSVGESSRVINSVLYTDGMGHDLQTKAQAPPESRGSGDRWITSGWKIYNNKGNPVREFEPFFSDTHEYQASVIGGVSTTLLLDSLQRTVAKLNPDHTWTMTNFTPWTQEAWDASDTILSNPLDDPNLSGYFETLPSNDYFPGWYNARVSGQLGEKEKEAAQKSAIHANTPTVSHFDAMGHAIVTISHNKYRRSSAIAEDFQVSRTDFDIKGNPLKIFDPLNRLVHVNQYDMLSNPIHASSSEAGKVWTLQSCLGLALYKWDSRGYEILAEHDEAQRPKRELVRKDTGPAALVSSTKYGENEVDAEGKNVRGKTVRLHDQAGVSYTVKYDFKGNALTEARQVLSGAAEVTDWSCPETVQLGQDCWKMHKTYDAFNRTVSTVEPDDSVVKLSFNVSGQIQSIKANLYGTAEWTSVVSDAKYNAKGQCVLRALGNGIITRYNYDPFTFRLRRLVSFQKHTDRDAHGRGNVSPSRDRVLQDLHYTYDPVGNIVSIEDHSQQCNFFQNHKVSPSSDYNYDALYRLITASGREHLGQAEKSSTSKSAQQSRTHHANDSTAMARYTEEYSYDRAGNILSVKHIGSFNWTKHYSYNEPSQLEEHKHNNRLSSTQVGNDVENFRYDANAGEMGNTTCMPGLSSMRWDYKNELQLTSRQRTSQEPETTWYQYSSSGERTRKITYRECGESTEARRKSERIYIGHFEVSRTYSGDGETVSYERETLRVIMGNERVLLAERTTVGTSPAPKELSRYQLGNLLGSAVLELDDSANIITYEEYYPYGGTSYLATRSQTDTPKRYRYSGKEKDEESGLYYYGARYFAASIGRWVSPDPGGMRDGPNLYEFVKCNPISNGDSDGAQAAPALAVAAEATATGAGTGGATAAPTLVVIEGGLATTTTTTATVGTTAAVGTGAVGGGATGGTLFGIGLTGWGLIIVGVVVVGGLAYYALRDKPKPTVTPPPQPVVPTPAPAPAPPVSPPVPIPPLPVETPRPAPAPAPAPAPNKKDKPTPTPRPPVSPKPKPKPKKKKDEDEGEPRIWHHVYPRQFEWFFDTVGIDINKKEEGRWLTKEKHDKVHYAFFYNYRWGEWIDQNINWKEYAEYKAGLRSDYTHPSQAEVRAKAFELELLVGTLGEPRPPWDYTPYWKAGPNKRKEEPASRMDFSKRP